MPPGRLNLTVANSNLILIPILWVHIFMLATHENVAIWVVAHMNVLVCRQEDGGLSMGGGQITSVIICSQTKFVAIV